MKHPNDLHHLADQNLLDLNTLYSAGGDLYGLVELSLFSQQKYHETILKAITEACIAADVTLTSSADDAWRSIKAKAFDSLWATFCAIDILVNSEFSNLSDVGAGCMEVEFPEMGTAEIMAAGKLRGDLEQMGVWKLEFLLGNLGEDLEA